MATLGASTAIHAKDAADLAVKIHAAAIATGKWTDSGDSTGDIVMGAADRMGRRPYIKIHVDAQSRCAFKVGGGSDGSGGITSKVGWTNQSINRSVNPSNGWAWAYTMFCTDRWIFIDSHERNYEGMMAGMIEMDPRLEPSVILADYECPVFAWGNYDGTTAVTPAVYERNAASNVQLLMRDSLLAEIQSAWPRMVYVDAAEQCRSGVNPSYGFTFTFPYTVMPYLRIGSPYFYDLICGHIKGIIFASGGVGASFGSTYGHWSFTTPWAILNEEGTWEVHYGSDTGQLSPGSNSGGCVMMFPTGVEYDPIAEYHEETY